MSNNKNKSNNKGSADAGSSNATTNSGKKRKVWTRTVNHASSCNSDSKSKNSSVDVGIASDNPGGYNADTGNPTEENRTSKTNTSKSGEDKSSYRISSNEKRTTGKGRTEVKISFGPSRPPTMSSSNGGGNRNSSNSGDHHHHHNSHLPPSSAAAAASMAAMMGYGSGNISFGELDLDALKEKAAAAAAGQKKFRNKQGLPCTEAEMKALMGMFVEIMGMSMNNKGGDSANASGVGSFNVGNMMYSNSDDGDFHKSTNGNSNSSNRNGGGPVFSFGATPMDASSLAAIAAAASGSSSGMIPDHMTAATAGFFADGASWEALRRTYAAAEQMVAADDDDEDDESFENRELTFEELEFLLHHRKQKEEAAKLASQFASGDWESLEQVAINEHLLSETDDRERKAAKKREKKQRRKAKLKEEAAQKAAELAQKKRDKAIVSWRSRVISACQSNEVNKLDGLLQESPLRKLMEEQRNSENGQTNGKDVSTSCIIPHLEFLLPISVAKNRAQVERGIEARLRLAEYVLKTELPLAFRPLRTGRTALHTACFYGDVRFLQLLFDKIESYEPIEEGNQLPNSFLDLTCDESGWSPLHYASVSGSFEVIELLLAKGCGLSTCTDVTHTWRESDGRGLTPRELVQCVQSGNYEKVIETHGLALQEMTNAFLNHHQERRIFMNKLDHINQRLSEIEKNGYTPLSKDKVDSMVDSKPQSEDAVLNRTEASSSRNKKKKKKKKKQSVQEEDLRPAANACADKTPSTSVQSSSIESKEEKDPLVTALLGMGFNGDQIMSAVAACGGTHRATADDLVTWILGQGDNEDTTSAAQDTSEKAQGGRVKNNQLQKEDSLRSSEKVSRQQQQQEAARQKEEAARRLAAKREEARRRNREWNNREQARQEKEAKAKVAQKVYNVSRSAVPGSDLSSKSNSRPRVNGLHTSNMTGNANTGIMSSARHPQTVNKWGVAPVTTQSQSFARPMCQPNVASHKANSAAPIASTMSEQQALPVSGFFASINDDEKTVSSFGSTRGMSVSSKEFVPLAAQAPIPPPGFTPNPSQPIAAPTRPPVATAQENPSVAPFPENVSQGKIRATAKAFVPSFSMLDGRDSNESLQNVFTPANDRSASQSNQSHDAGLAPAILPQQGSFNVSHNSFLGSRLQSSLQNSFDNATSTTPPSTESVVPGTSFIVGSKTTEQAITIPFRLGQGDSKENSNIGGSRLLNSISNDTPVGSTSIWGDKQNIPSLESALHPSFFGNGNGDESIW